MTYILQRVFFKIPCILNFVSNLPVVRKNHHVQPLTRESCQKVWGSRLHCMGELVWRRAKLGHDF